MAAATNSHERKGGGGARDRHTHSALCGRVWLRSRPGDVHGEYRVLGQRGGGTGNRSQWPPPAAFGGGALMAVAFADQCCLRPGSSPRRWAFGELHTPLNKQQHHECLREAATYGVPPPRVQYRNSRRDRLAHSGGGGPGVSEGPPWHQVPGGPRRSRAPASPPGVASYRRPKRGMRHTWGGPPPGEPARRQVDRSPSVAEPTPLGAGY
jgi:hypothetical protein